MFRVVATAIITAVLTSAFWIFVYNIAWAPKEPNGAVTAEGVEVGPLSK